MNEANLPISEIIKKSRREPEPTEDEQQTKRSRQENYKKAKELDEARKAGNAPAAVDEEGKDINPHIPQYISTVPFFYNTDKPTLRHQRSNKSSQKHVPLDVSYQRGLRIQNATKFRPGACENCGAMTHKKKDCLERPRKVGAKFSNKDIAPDEVILPDIEHSFDSKRDRWAGFKPEMYKPVIEEFEKVEEAKRKLKEETMRRDAAAVSAAADEESSTTEANAKSSLDVVVTDDLDADDDEDEDEKYADKADMPGTRVDTKQRMTVRNLRLREDTAKYLHNLDLDSAYYDPKSRSMRADALPISKDASVTDTCVGENFIRFTGEVVKVNEAQVFAWQAAERGIDIHLQALPTKTEIIKKEFDIKKNEYKERISNYTAKNYGEPEKEVDSSKYLHLEQSEAYVEYSRTGKVVKCIGPVRPGDLDDTKRAGNSSRGNNDIK